MVGVHWLDVVIIDFVSLEFFPFSFSWEWEWWTSENWTESSLQNKNHPLSIQLDDKYYDPMDFFFF